MNLRTKKMKNCKIKNREKPLLSFRLNEEKNISKLT